MQKAQHRKYRFFLTILVCMIWVQTGVFAQRITLDILPEDTDTTFFQENTVYETSFVDTFSLYNQLADLRLQLNGQGYLEASTDSLIWKDSTATAHFHLGKQYEWAFLKNGNVENTLLEQTGFRERLYQNKVFTYEQLREAQERILSYAENNGFPFAVVWLDNVKIKEGRISAELFMNKGQFVTFTGIETEGSARISNQYLENYFGIKEGEPYSKKKILDISARAKELPFVKEKRTAVISFSPNSATVNLFLSKKKASRFDFLVGLLPGEREDINGVPVQRLLVTGELNGELQNQFGKGERIYLKFERLRPSVQEIELEFNYPYILELPFGADVSFQQFRRDSTFNNVGFDAGVRYLLEGGNYLKAFYSNTFTNVQFIDTDKIIETRRLPENSDVGITGFGLEYLYQKLDYRFNPKRGLSIFLRANAGIKTVQPNSEILDLSDPEDLSFKFQTLYDSLELKSFQYNFQTRIARYFPLGSSSTIKAGINGGYILSQQPIYQNEQFRIGGNRLLRGFDEESIFATVYAVGTLEYRLLIGQNSYFYVFGDYAYTENRTTEVRAFDRPYGFGGGLTFETGAGIFGVSLAVGSQQGNPINLRNPKVHFGYVSVF